MSVVSESCNASSNQLRIEVISEIVVGVFTSKAQEDVVNTSEVGSQLSACGSNFRRHNLQLNYVSLLKALQKSLNRRKQMKRRWILNLIPCPPSNKLHRK